MKYKNFLIRLFDLILVLGLLAGYQAVIYSRDKEATIAELKSQVNQLQGEKEDILEAVRLKRIKMETILEVRRDLEEKSK